MSVFVLVHGGWHGGWCWRDLAAILRAQGHEVHAPSLTGLADRGHLIDAVAGPDTHVEDIVRLIAWENLHDIVLVGHSYGGTIVTGVASRLPERIARLVYLDAFVPTASGESAAALSPARAAEVARMRRPDGHTDPSAFERWVSPERIAWIKTMTTPQPGTCFDQGVTLTGREAEVPVREFILCTRNRHSPFWQFHERYRDDPRWICHQIDSLHDAMIEAPQALAAILTRV
jgi:pimeloyl-ACP methyl ester carboxylesterase